MSAPPPRIREHLRTNPDALPDPKLWAGGRSPFGGAVRRIVLFGAAGGAALALSVVAVRTVLHRAPGTAADGPSERASPLAADERRAPAKRALTPQEIADLNRSWVGSETIAPRDAQLDRATGEHVAPFQGFGVDVE